MWNILTPAGLPPYKLTLKMGTIGMLNTKQELVKCAQFIVRVFNSNVLHNQRSVKWGIQTEKISLFCEYSSNHESIMPFTVKL